MAPLNIRVLPDIYDTHDPDASARRLVYQVRPEWHVSDSTVEFVRFTDGITNTLLKAVNKEAGLSSEEVDRQAILLRAYGNGTDLIIDRQREAQNHELLMRHGLAPELLARFGNGIIYRFIRGTVTRPEDLRRPEISMAIARRLAQWHAIVPCIPEQRHETTPLTRTYGTSSSDKKSVHEISSGPSKKQDENDAQQATGVSTPGKLSPNIWTVMQKWISALPTETEAQQHHRTVLQGELDQLIGDLSQRPGLGQNGLVFAHNDLLSGNVIVLPARTGSGSDGGVEVTFIDYEYAVPSPAAFDIANHFAEWGGFDCDMTVLPTVAQRRSFINEYICTYASLTKDPVPIDTSRETAKLLDEVDVFRGLPGFYWGIWALIQATISEINFDYGSYAKTRLSEYWAWKAEVDGSRAASGATMPLRERRWAQETDEDVHL